MSNEPSRESSMLFGMLGNFIWNTSEPLVVSHTLNVLSSDIERILAWFSAKRHFFMFDVCPTKRIGSEINKFALNTLDKRTKSKFKRTWGVVVEIKEAQYLVIASGHEFGAVVGEVDAFDDMLVTERVNLSAGQCVPELSKQYKSR